jgi:hypothetical protein
MKTKIAKLDITQTVIAHADSLAERHSLHIKDFVCHANAELYTILAEIYKLYKQVEGGKQRDKLIKKMREHLKSSNNIKTQANLRQALHPCPQVLDFFTMLALPNCFFFINQHNPLLLFPQKILKLK